MIQHLFVCGTLLPELVPAHLTALVGRFTSVGEAFLPGMLYDLGEYPGAVLDQTAQSRVRGWVYQLPEDKSVLQALDEYEGINPDKIASSLFLRTTVEAKLAAGETLPCWIYVYNRDVDNRPQVPDGDYLKYRSAKLS